MVDSVASEQSSTEDSSRASCVVLVRLDNILHHYNQTSFIQTPPGCGFEREMPVIRESCDKRWLWYGCKNLKDWSYTWESHTPRTFIELGQRMLTSPPIPKHFSLYFSQACYCVTDSSLIGLIQWNKTIYNQTDSNQDYVNRHSCWSRDDKEKTRHTGKGKQRS